MVSESTGSSGEIQLHRRHFPSTLGKLRRQRADARADFQHAAGLIRSRGRCNIRRYLGINQKVLPHGFGEVEAVPAQQLPNGFLVT